jgi:FHS family L-fucose permease-like MFS transporter
MAHLSHEKAASSLVAYYWGSAMIGRLLGSIIGQKVKAEVMLRTVAVVALVLVALSVSGIFNNTWMNVEVMVLNPDPFFISFNSISIPVSAFLLVIVGLFNSVMWPCIFPLSLNGLGKHTSQGSGILVMMVVGGALIPLLQGALAGVSGIGYQYSFIIVLACYAYILFFALKGYINQNESSEEPDSIDGSVNVRSTKPLASTDA